MTRPATTTRTRVRWDRVAGILAVSGLTVAMLVWAFVLASDSIR